MRSIVSLSLLIVACTPTLPPTSSTVVGTQIADGTTLIFDPSNPCNKANTTYCPVATPETWPVAAIGVKYETGHTDEVWVAVNLPSGNTWNGTTAVEYWKKTGTPANDFLTLGKNSLNNAEAANRWRRGSAGGTSTATNAELVVHQQSTNLLKPDGTSYTGSLSEATFCHDWKAKLLAIWGSGAEVACFKNPERAPRNSGWEG